MAKTSKAEFLRCEKKFEWLKPLFRELEGVIEKYVDWAPEPLYANNENPSVSMLVAAGARANYVVLADYRSDKTKDGRSVRGRADLLLGKGERWLEIEAKMTYVVEGTNPQTINRRLTKACDSAQENVGRRRAGLLFATMNTPFTRKVSNWQPDEFRTRFQNVAAEFCWMWYDTTVSEKYRWNRQGPAYPGLGIFLQSI